MAMDSLGVMDENQMMRVWEGRRSVICGLLGHWVVCSDFLWSDWEN